MIRVGKHKKTAIYLLVIILVNSLIVINSTAASLPEPYGNNQFEGFQDGIQIDPLLGVVDPDAPPMNLGAPCPCPPVLGGPCPGHLIIDPFDGDGLTCDNDACPCGYYVEPDWVEGMFLGFPTPLTNDVFSLIILSFMYGLGKFIVRRKQSNKLRES